MRTRAEIVSFNAGLDTVAQLAAASADKMRRRIAEKPTRFAYAIAALDGVVEACDMLRLPVPPDGTAPIIGIIPPSPPPPQSSESAAQLAEVS